MRKMDTIQLIDLTHGQTFTVINYNWTRSLVPDYTPSLSSTRFSFALHHEDLGGLGRWQENQFWDFSK